MPPLLAGRPLKRWRYVGIFSDDLMLCAADVRVGPLRQRFYAVAEPAGRVLGGTRLRGIRIERSHLHVSSGGVRIDIGLDEDGGVETLHRHGRGYVWTRKQAGIAAHGIVELPGRPPRLLDARAVIDDTAGYHPRELVALVGRGRRAGQRRARCLEPRQRDKRRPHRQRARGLGRRRAQ